MATFFCASNGSDANPGTASQPWSGAWALSSANTALQPGDVVKVLDLIQFPCSSTQSFTATKAGTAQNPILYEPAFLDQRAGFGGNVILGGANVVLRDLELTWNNMESRDGIAGESTLNRWYSRVDPQAANIRYLGCQIHDQLSGMFAGTLAPGLRVDDCIIYNNGVDGPIRGHGHSLYIQGEEAAVGKSFRNILSWGGYRHGMQYYGTGGSKVHNLTTEDCAFFAMGVSSVRSGEAPILVTWQSSPGDAGNLTWRRNSLFHVNSRTYRVGVSPLWDVDALTFEDNWIRGSMEMVRVNQITIRRNMLWTQDAPPDFPQAVNPLTYEMQSGQPFTAHTIDENEYFKQSTGPAFNLTNWRATTGWDLNSTSTNANPTGFRVRAVPTRGTRRALGHLHIWNFQNASSATVDIGPAVNHQTGIPYAIYHVFDFVTGGAPLVQGTYDGTRVTIPMDVRTPPEPYGSFNPQPAMPNTFGAFVVTQRPGWSFTLGSGL